MKQSTHKNVGSFLAFTEEWFSQNQPRLLFLLNNPLTKRWFRWILRIRLDDCALSEKITQIAPNRFSYGDKIVGEKIERTTDFRVHPKFGKRIYYAFKPVWWAVHFWDEFFADRHAPALSYGFSTLTVYPQAGNGGANVTCDMDMSRNTAGTFSAIRTGAGENTSDIGNCRIGLEHVGSSYDELKRSGQTFDTSALGSSAIISGAVLSLYENGENDTGSKTPSINAVSFAPASNKTFVASDYGNFGTTKYSDTDISYASWAGSAAYNALTFNATGIAAISLTGVTKIGIREVKYDIANSDPALSGSQSYYMYWYSADETGTSKDPKLVITYTAPTAWTKTVTDTSTSTAILAKTPIKVLLNTITSTAAVTAFRGRVKTVLDTVTSTAILKKTPVKVLLNTVTSTAAIAKTTARTFLNTVTSTAILAKTPNKVLLNTVTSTANLAKTTNKVLLNTITSTASLAKALSRTFLNTVTSTEILTKLRTAYITVLNSATSTSAIAKTTNKVLLNAVTSTASLSRALSRTLLDTVTSTAILAKGFARTFLNVVTATNTNRFVTILRNGLTMDLSWLFGTKHSASWTNQTKHSSSWTNQNKNTTNWTNQNKS